MFTEQAPTEYRDWADSDHDLYDAVAMGMHARGAMPEPDSREPWFICEAHAREDIVDRVVSIFADSLSAALEARARGEMREVDAAQWSMSSNVTGAGAAKGAAD
jgi:glutamate-1-semialdehyde 2,1-aminomutase